MWSSRDWCCWGSGGIGEVVDGERGVGVWEEVGVRFRGGAQRVVVRGLRY